VLLLGGRALAVDSDEILRAQADALELEDLRQAAQEYAPDMDWTQTPDLDGGLSALLETGTQSLHGVVKKALRSGVLLLTIVFLSALADGAAACGTGRVPKAAALAAALSITAVSAADANTLIGLGREVMEEMENFSKVLLPTMAAATAASGSPGGAAARQMAAMLFSDVLMTLINRVLLPLVYAYIAACTAYAALGNEGLKRIAATVKWVVTTLLTGVLMVFVGYLTVSGVIAGTTDAATLKAAKLTVSSVVPVVGGILSDAAETVLAGAGILKNTVGVFGMLAVLGMCLLPFLQLGVHYLIYKVTAALSATVAQGRVAGLIDGIGGAFGLVLGMVGACGLLLLISMISAVSLVSS
jgi:stage III sporulation protein AE